MGKLNLLLKKISPVLIFIAVPAVALYEVSFGIYAMKYDMANQFFPNRYFISQCLHNHILPLWCPYINCGFPFHADPQGGMFYPVTTIISVLFGYNLATVGWEYLLNIVIAATGFYLLLRNLHISKAGAISFGVIYSLSGIFISNAQHLSWMASLAWMPFILLYFKRILEAPSLRDAIKFAFSLFMTLTGGYIGLLIILAYFLIFYAISYFFLLLKKRDWSIIKPLILYGFAGILVLVLFGCGYIFSFGESLSHIVRGKPVTLDQANSGPLSPRAAISFLFPFAVTCQSYWLDTDISMANVYGGFLLFPFLLFALLKAKLTPFQKAFLLFGLVCFAAALGKYFFVRSILYHFPGLNFLRGASMFRVFGLLALLLVAPSGFDWLKNDSAATESKKWFIKILWAWLIILLLIVLWAFIKCSFQLKIPVFFSLFSVLDFNSRQNIYAHILFQGGIQWALLLFIIATFQINSLSQKIKWGIICLIMIADMAVAAQLNVVSTITSTVKIDYIQAKLNKLPHNFPIPEKPLNDYSEYGDSSTNPIWFNFSMLKEIPAADGFNSFYLNSLKVFDESADKWKWLKNPVIFFDDSAIPFVIKRFYPGEVLVDYNARNNDRLTLLQANYKGWQIWIDSSEAKVEERDHFFISAAVPAGSHEVKFVYRRPFVKFLFFVSQILLGGTFLYLAYAGLKRCLNS